MRIGLVRNHLLRTSAALLGWMSILVWPTALHGQTPIGEEMQINVARHIQHEPRGAMSSQGRIAVVWRGSVPAPPEGFISEVRDRVFDAAGRPLTNEVLLFHDLRSVGLLPVVAFFEGGNHCVAWSETPSGDDSRADVLLRRLDSLGRPVDDSEIVNEVQRGDQLAPALSIDESEGGAIAWETAGLEGPSQDGSGRGVFGRSLDANCIPTGPELQISSESAGHQRRPDVAASSSGASIFVWQQGPDEEDVECDVYFRILSRDGLFLGPDRRVNTHLPNCQGFPAVASGSQGSFVVVWESALQDVSEVGIYGQRFDALGEPLGAEFRVNTSIASAQISPKVASDAHGNFVVVWQAFDRSHRPEVRGQLFRADGRRVAGEILIPNVPEIVVAQTAPDVAFGGNGTFVVSWESCCATELNDILAQRFAASPGAEPCLLRGTEVRCDTGRTGGAPELTFSFGRRPGETTLAGDFDGDGRDDPCARFGNRFRCDLDHEGAPAETAISFGLAEDTALMGDLDGDGRDEACVRRRRRFLCDTGHDGGEAEVSISFGRIGETALLGDLDGDGRDDPCLWRNGELACDLAHGGGRPDLTLRFGRAGDFPALGDIDGDDRDDLCVLRGARLLCDTAHDGGAAEVELDLGAVAGDRLLLGNFDGL
ncbi:MAG: hypothetical protein ACJ76J_09365 [Thermoanaerobaculia bacterium]